MVSLSKTFLVSYILSCSHLVRTSFDSHHLVLLIYLIPNISKIRISIVIEHILRQFTSYYISTRVFSSLKIPCLNHRPYIFQIISYILTFHSYIHTLSKFKFKYLKNFIIFNINLIYQILNQNQTFQTYQYIITSHIQSYLWQNQSINITLLYSSIILLLNLSQLITQNQTIKLI